MSALAHYFKQDLSWSSSGDLAVATDIQELEQRVLRGLMTSPGNYIFAPLYGAGLGRYVGIALSGSLKNQIIGLIKSVLVLEPDIQKSPAPIINLNSDANGFTGVMINYIYTPTGQAQTIVYGG